MSDPDEHLQLTLQNDMSEIGGVFRGRLVRVGDMDDLAEDSESRVRAVRLRLHYKTEGRGDTDSKTIETHEFPADEYGAVNADFELAIPDDGPISYDGQLIRVLWEIEARVDIKMRRDKRTTAAVLVLPTNGWGLYNLPHPLRRR